jgi:AraC family transcriptional regulator, transcriptional activator FtrA
MTIYVKIMPNLKGPLVAALVYDGLCTFEFGLVAEIFGLSRPEMGDDWYRFVACPIEPGPLRAQGGLVIQTDVDMGLFDKADIIVVPGWKGVDAPVPESLVHALCAAHDQGARLVSICSGAFVLAETGLLNGATATTHWRYASDMRRRFPAVAVDETSLYRSHNNIFTSAGSAAGIDLLIEIVRQDYGPETANSVARRMVIPAHRTGGQAQFLEQPVRLREGTEIAPFLDAIRTRLAEPWTIARMADEVRMSDRTFLRRFFEATGGSPGEWLASERIELVKNLLCAGDQSIEEVATAAGMGSAQTMRHHFRRLVGISPTEYRSRFRARPQPAMSVFAA